MIVGLKTTSFATELISANRQIQQKDKKYAFCFFFIDNRYSYLSLDLKEHRAPLSIVIIITTATVSLSNIVIVIVWTPPIHKDAPSSSTVSAA